MRTESIAIFKNNSNLLMCNGQAVPVVMSWLIPSTEIEALEIALPCRSRTKPLTPRWTWTHRHTHRKKRQHLFNKKRKTSLCILQLTQGHFDITGQQVHWKETNCKQLGLWYRVTPRQKPCAGFLYLLDVVDQWVAVLLPVVLQCVLIGKLVAAELQGDLKAVAAEVVEILHSCNDTVREKANVWWLSEFPLGDNHLNTKAMWPHLQARCTRPLR